MANQIVVSAGAKVRNLNGVLTGTTGVVNSLPINAANGIPQLDVNGKILVSQLPNSVMEYKGTWNANTNTPTLANGTGNQGDVYLCNVAGTTNFGAGAIAFVVGDQVIYSGSIWQRASGATGTVTSVAVTKSGDSLNITGSPITTSGTINIGFNGTNLQYVNGAGNLTTFPTLITSIGLSMPSAFSVANSPLTANGTIAVTGAGVASQYIRGDGTLASFPTGGGGGSSVSYYLNGGTNQGTFVGNTYYEMSKTAVIGTGVDFTINANGYISQFITDANDPAQLVIPAGNWNFEMYFSASSNGGSPSFYVQLYKYNGSTFTLIADNSANPEYITNGTAVDLYTTAVAVPETSLTITDRLAIRVYVTHASKTITLHTQNSHLCQIITTFSTGITALNGLTAQVQYFQTGTSGTDFNISSTTATHTFNIPSASATNRGLVTTGSQTIAGSKTFNATLYGTDSEFSGSVLSPIFSVLNGTKVVNLQSLATLNRDIYLPDASGTIALLEGTQTFSGSKTFTGSATFNNTLGNSIILNYGAALVKGNTPSSTSGVWSNIYAAAGSNNLVIADDVNISKLQFQAASTYTYTFPSASGTIALTSDLGAYLPLAGGTMTGAIVGTTSTFTNGGSGIGVGITLSGASGDGLKITHSAGRALNIASSGAGYGIIINNETASTSAPFTIQKQGSNVITMSDTGAANFTGQLTLGSTITNGSSTYTLPSATGTLALTSQLTSGTVTSVAALTIGTSGTDLSSSVANSTTTPVITLNVPTASASNRGALSSADWSTFNNKQSALTNPVTGTGTTNYLPKFTGASTIGNSLVYDNGTNVGINTASPSTYTNLTTLTINGTNGSVIDLKTANTLYGEIYSLANELRIDAVGASSVLKFLTNSVTRATIDASGNLGLGVTPSSWSDFKVLELANGAHFASYTSGVNILDIGINYYFNGAGYVYNTNGYTSRYEMRNGEHKFLNSASGTAGNAITFTQAMTLFANGNLAVGTTTDSGYKLDVNGTGRFIATSLPLRIQSTTNYETSTLGTATGTMGYISSNGLYGMYIGIGNSGNTWLQSQRNDGNTAAYNLLLQPNGGNVGIGTSSPLFSGFAQLTVNGTQGGIVIQASSSGISRLFFAKDDTSNAEGLIRYAHTDNSMQFFTNAVEKMRITSAGDLLVGLSSSTYSTTNRTSIVANGTTTALFGLVVGGVNKGYFYSTGTNILLMSEDASGYMSFGTNNAERMRITNGGNVLIGTTTDATGKLQVNGTIYATGFYESSDIRFKNIIETNPTINLSGIDVIKFTRKDNDINQVRYGYSAQQVQSILPDAVTGTDFLNVNYLDVHTLKIAQLEQEIKELKAKMN